MVAVTERVESKRLADTMLALPLAISTTIVSPMARPKPSTTAANTPGAAAGSTICHAACHFEAPRASAPCVYTRGTLVSASSAIENTTGITANPSAMPETKAFNRD